MSLSNPCYTEFKQRKSCIFLTNPLLSPKLDCLGESLPMFSLTCFVARIIVPLSHEIVAV